MSNLGEYVQVAILHHIRYNDKSPFLAARTYEAIKKHISDVYKSEIPTELIMQAVDELISSGCGRIISDPYTSNFVIINETGADNFYNGAINAEASIFERADLVGVPFIRQALKNIAAREFADHEDLENKDYEDVAGIPAADRIVRLDDNSSARDEIVEKIADLRKSVQETNDPDGRLPNKDRIVAELDAGSTLLKVPRARLRAIWVVLGPALYYLMSQFGDTVVGGLAGDLYNALKTLLGI
jgi:hypothetical protein